MKASVRSVGLWMVLLSALLASSGSCGHRGTQDTSRAGRLKLSLVGTSTSGVQYRLRNGSFHITGLSEADLLSETDPRVEALTVELATGSYRVELLSGWYLEKAAADATFVPVYAVLVSANPVDFTIRSQEVTSVEFRFRAGDDVIPIGSGVLAISIAVDDGTGGMAGAGGAGGSGGTAEPGLVAFYPFNGNANDESGHGYHATAHGSPVLTEDRHGVANRAYAFNGSGDYLSIGKEPNFPSWNAYSVSVWFLDDGLSTKTHYGNKIIDKSVMYHDFYIAVQGVVRWDTTDPSTWQSRQSAGYDYRDNLWHHVAVSKTGSHGELWIDGVLVATSEDVLQVSNDADLLIGYTQSADYYQQNYWSGKLDDIRIYDRALSGPDVLRLYSE